METSSVNLSIDDLDLEDESPPRDKDGTKTRRKTPNLRSLMKKVKKSLSGKKKSNDEINKQPDDSSAVGRPRTIDEIKATYGQGKGQDSTSTAALMRDKLLEQRERLQAIDKKTAEMQDGAQDFQKNAEELVSILEEKNKKRIF